MEENQEIKKKVLEEFQSMKDNVNNAINNIEKFEGVDFGYEVMQNGAFIHNINNIIEILKEDKSFDSSRWQIKK